MLRFVESRATAGAANCKQLFALAFVALFVAFAGVAMPAGATAEAAYSQLQSKMAGNYDRFSKGAASSRRAASGKRNSRRAYGKSRGKKTYKKYNSRQKRYTRRKSAKGASAARRTRTTNRQKPKGARVAALSPTTLAPRTSLSGGGVRWVASAGCLNSRLKAVVYDVASRFGPVTVSSTCRSKKRNASVGGARKSKHLSGNAVDVRVHANHRAAYAYLKSAPGVGGYKHYGGGLFHIDTGPRRSW